VRANSDSRQGSSKSARSRVGITIATRSSPGTAYRTRSPLSVATIVAGPDVRRGVRYAAPVDHYGVLGTVEGLKRFVTMHESPYHGLNFCQGTIAEMLDDPAREIFEVIRWFGERGKIFNVHFRNIKGRKLDFMEAFPDEGDMDMPRSLAAYRDIGYPYMLMPDHVPQIDGRDPSGVAFAYCYGYIQALLDALVRGTGRPHKGHD